MMTDAAPIPAPTSSQASPPTPQTVRRLQRRQDRRRIAVQQRQERAKARKLAEEARAEQLAPQVQRITVYARDGKTVLRGPRVEQQGVTMIRSNPVKRLAARSRSKEFPTIGEAHVTAADRLLTDWEEGHGSIGHGCMNYAERTSTSNTPGSISDAVIAAINTQTDARDNIVRVQERLGALWPVIHAVVICNVDPSAWGEAQGMNPHISVGYVVAALDLLVRCYQPREREQRGKIRFVEFVSSDFPIRKCPT
jgi:hypothetical protein